MHANSLAAYDEIRVRGLLSKRRMQTLGAVVKLCALSGPPTASEVATELVAEFGTHSCNANSRLIELEERGVVMRSGSKESYQSGFAGETWEPTGEMPKEPSRREGTTDRLRRELQESEAACHTWQQSYLALADVCYRNGFKHDTAEKNGPAKLAAWLESRLSTGPQGSLFE